MSVDALCSYQVANSNSKLMGSQVPGDKDKLQALIAECVKNYERQQAQETQKERQSSWQKAPDVASTPPGAALVPAPGAGSSAAVPRSALPALQAPAKVDPTAAARALPNVPLACSMNSKGMKYGSGMPQRHYEVVARNNSGSNLPAVYRMVWTIENAKPAQAGMYKLRAPLAANASIGVGTAVTEPERAALFNTVLKGQFGDVIHSEPSVVYYSNGPDGLADTADDDVKILVGANDGMLHCIDDVTGNEVWAFIPPDQLGRLTKLNDADHDYFVDGSPTVYYGASQKILIIGSRRGGEFYTAIDITDYNAPRYLYTVGPSILGSGNEVLGQSWSRPEKATIATSSTSTPDGCAVNITVNTADVLLIGGGYDTNQDQPTPSASDTEGRVVFAVNLTTGALMNSPKFSYGAPSGLGMTHSVVDLAGFDPDGDGIVSRIYFGDMGGNVFALKDDVLQEFTVCSKTIRKSVVDGTWTGVKLFNASADNVMRKIFYAPDAVDSVKQFAGGFAAGFTALPSSVFNDAPENEYEAIANEIGHLAGFVGLFPGIGTIGNIGVKGISLGAKALQLGSAVQGVRRFAMAEKALSSASKGLGLLANPVSHFRSMPLLAGDVALGWLERRAPAKIAESYLMKSTAGKLGIAGGKQAFHLGVANAFSEASYLVFDDKKLGETVTDAMHAAAYGGLFGGIFGAGVGSLWKIKGLDQGSTAATALRSIAGSLAQGLPSTVGGQSTEQQIYAYLMGGIFGAYSPSPERYIAGRAIQKLSDKPDLPW